jgi:hypothetical protein
LRWLVIFYRLADHLRFYLHFLANKNKCPQPNRTYSTLPPVLSSDVKWIYSKNWRGGLC